MSRAWVTLPERCGTWGGGWCDAHAGYVTWLPCIMIDQIRNAFLQEHPTTPTVCTHPTVPWTLTTTHTMIDAVVDAIQSAYVLLDTAVEHARMQRRVCVRKSERGSRIEDRAGWRSIVEVRALSTDRKASSRESRGQRSDLIVYMMSDPRDSRAISGRGYRIPHDSPSPFSILSDIRCGPEQL
jgi:hypothetical protein